jgi:hypothetical protein
MEIYTGHGTRDSLPRPAQTKIHVLPLSFVRTDVRTQRNLHRRTWISSEYFWLSPIILYLYHPTLRLFLYIPPHFGFCKTKPKTLTQPSSPIEPCIISIHTHHFTIHLHLHIRLHTSTLTFATSHHVLHSHSFHLQERNFLQLRPVPKRRD